MTLIAIGPHDALVILDPQNDFLPGGSLPVPDAEDLQAHGITRLFLCGLASNEQQALDEMRNAGAQTAASSDIAA